jgi:hypothetical protein
MLTSLAGPPNLMSGRTLSPPRAAPVAHVTIGAHLRPRSARLEAPTRTPAPPATTPVKVVLPAPSGPTRRFINLVIPKPAFSLIGQRVNDLGSQHTPTQRSPRLAASNTPTHSVPSYLLASPPGLSLRHGSDMLGFAMNFNVRAPSAASSMMGPGTRPQTEAGGRTPTPGNTRPTSSAITRAPTSSAIVSASLIETSDDPEIVAVREAKITMPMWMPISPAPAPSSLSPSVHDLAGLDESWTSTSLTAAVSAAAEYHISPSPPSPSLCATGDTLGSQPVDTLHTAQLPETDITDATAIAHGDGDDDGEVEVVEVEHEDGALTVDVTDPDSVDANGELNLTEEKTVMATMAESPRAFFPPIGHSVCLGLCVDCD